VGGENRCVDQEVELLSFPKAVNDDASDSAAYQTDLAQPPGNILGYQQVSQTHQRLKKN
jgi:hypothetical protein